jgi:KAP family P-loop domain
MSKFHTDGAILGTDESPDLLNRTTFAKNIADTILTLPKNSGFVLSLEAPWGHGKTSVLNLIQQQFEQYEEDKRPVVCQFNPWMIGNAETLVQSLLVQLATSIGLTSHAKEGKKVAQELLAYSSVFSVLKFVPGAEPWATIIKGIFEAVGTSTDKISDLKKLDIEKHRDAVVEAMRELKRKVVIVIDDIDRLPPKEVFEIVRLVKAIADFPGVIYILCYDPQYVEAALKSSQIEQPGLYLDKIVQMRLNIPVIDQDDLDALFNQEYDALPKESKFSPDLERRLNSFWYQGLSEILETPRDIKRLFNRIRFVEPGCRGNVNLADLLSLEAIALKAPTVYQHLHKQREAYVDQYSFKKRVVNIKEYQPARAEALAKVPQHYQEPIRSLLSELFPQLKGSSFNHSVAAAQGLICVPDRLAVALSAGLPSREVSYADAIKFFSSKEDRPDILQNILEKRLFPRFIDQLRRAVRETKVDDPEDLITQLGQVLDTPSGAESIRQSNNISFLHVCDSTMYLTIELLKQVGEQQRFSIFNNLVGKPQMVSLSTYLIYELGKEDKPYEELKLTISPKEFSHLKVTLQENLKFVIQNGEILNFAESRGTIQRLTFLYPGMLAQFIDTLTDSDEKFDKYITSITSGGSDSDKGEFVFFEESPLEEYGGAQCLKIRAKERLTDSSVQGELKFILSALLSGDRIYLSDGSKARW